jgi:biotin carboxyl carrier protein
MLATFHCYWFQFNSATNPAELTVVGRDSISTESREQIFEFFSQAPSNVIGFVVSNARAGARELSNLSQTNDPPFVARLILVNDDGNDIRSPSEDGVFLFLAGMPSVTDIEKMARMEQFRRGRLATKPSDDECRASQVAIEQINDLLLRRSDASECCLLVYDAEVDQIKPLNGESFRPNFGVMGRVCRLGIIHTVCSDAIALASRVDVYLPVLSSGRLCGVWQLLGVDQDTWNSAAAELCGLAEFSATAVSSMLPMLHAGERTRNSELILAGSAAPLFRHAAVHRHRELTDYPAYNGFAWFDGAGLMSVIIGLLLFFVVLFTGSVSEDTRGIGIVLPPDEEVLYAEREGTVARVHVRSGIRVRQGDPLLVISLGKEHAELRALEQAYGKLMRRRLLSLDRDTDEAEVVALRQRLEIAREQTKENVLTSPIDGFVGAVSVRAGDYLSSGERLLSLRSEDGSVRIRAAITADHSGVVGVDSTVYLRLAEYRDQPVALQVVDAGEVPALPEELPRLFPSLRGSDRFSGPMTVFKARVAQSELQRPESLRLTPGMAGEIELTVRRRPLWTFLVKWKDS